MAKKKYNTAQMTRMLLITTFFLSACGHQEIPTPRNFDYQGNTGTMVSFDTEVALSGEEIESYFINAHQCMLEKGFISEPVIGPKVLVVDYEPHGYQGYTEPSGLIVVWSGMPGIMQHESIHYILLASGKEWIGHSSPAFQCSVTINAIVIPI